MSGDEEERKSIQQTSQMFAAQITQLLFKVPRVLLLLLKTNDCLRSVDLALGEVRVVEYLPSCCVMNVPGITRFMPPRTSSADACECVLKLCMQLVW